MREIAFAAYLIGPSITILGIVLTFAFGGIEGAAVGAALILGGLLVVCAGMIVRAMALSHRERDRS